MLDTDTSDVGVGTVLSPIQGGKERIIFYYSKTLVPPESNCCMTRKDLLAMVKAVKYFPHHLCERRFTSPIDHASLSWLRLRKEFSNLVARRLEIVAELNYSLERGVKVRHGNAAGLGWITQPLASETC